MDALLKVKETRILFATKHHRNSNDEPMDFSSAHYIKALYNTLAPEIVVIGGTQVMKTEWLLIDHFAMAYNGYSCFFVLRNGEARDAYVQSRINNVLESVEFYRKVRKDAAFDRVDIKKFHKGRIKYVGSTVESDFREFPAHAMYVDETNDCNEANVRFGFSRLDGSIYKFKRFVSNSKSKDSLAEKLFERTNKQEWNVPCMACSKHSKLDWFNTVVKAVEDSSGNIVDYVLRDKEWRPGCGRDIHTICPHCGGVLLRLSDKGLWIPENDDEVAEGFRIPSLCSSIASVSELWREFEPAINDPHEMQRFFVRRLALPYSAIGSKVNVHILDKCKGGYKMVIRPDRAFVEGDSHAGPCSMGVDVGSETSDVRISEVLGANRRRALFIGKIMTRELEEQLDELAERYNVQTMCIDIQPEQGRVTEYQENSDRDIWLIKVGSSAPTKQETRNDRNKIISPNRTELLDRTYGQIQAGRNILPDNYEEILSGGYVNEMTAMAREMQLDANGNSYYVWEGNGRDHQRFADAYDYLAAKMISDETCVIGSDCIYIPNKEA